MRNIIQGVSTQYSAILHENRSKNEKLNDLTEIDIIPIITAISLVIRFIHNSHSGVL